MKPVKKRATKEVSPAKLLENTRKKMDKLKIKRQLEMEKINLKKQQDLEKFQAKKEIAYKKKIDNINSKIDLSSKNLTDLENLLK
jgi:polyhydroxyalkanoate synthesis regulator phasin